MDAPRFESKQTLLARLRPELAEALAAVRPALNPSRAATHVLDAESDMQILLGVEHGGDRAIHFNRLHRSITATPFDDTGLDGMHRRRLHHQNAQLHAYAWVHSKGATYWTWLHPRVRWVFDEKTSGGNIPPF
jgi:hypothetical protein